jgi:hypothetical protein
VEPGRPTAGHHGPRRRRPGPRVPRRDRRHRRRLTPWGPGPLLGAGPPPVAGLARFGAGATQQRRPGGGHPSSCARSTSSGSNGAAPRSRASKASHCGSGCAGSSKPATPGGPTTGNSAATPTGEPATATPLYASPPTILIVGRLIDWRNRWTLRECLSAQVLRGGGIICSIVFGSAAQYRSVLVLPFLHWR